MLLIKYFSRPIAKFFSVLLITVNFSAVCADQPALHQVKDLAYGASLFNFYQENYFSSITDLLVAEHKQSVNNHGDEPELLLGSLYLLYGLHDEAAEIFKALVKNTSNTATTDQAWFYLAKV